MRSCSREDLAIRKYIMENLPQAAISKVVIERPAKLGRVYDLRRCVRVSFNRQEGCGHRKAALQACHHDPEAR